MAVREEKIKDIIYRLATEFMSRESNRTSLITITNVVMSDNGGTATIFFTVLPDDKEKAALDFAKRMRSDFREFVMEKSKIGRIPFFDFAIDKGEKNRQRIDEISNTQ